MLDPIKARLLQLLEQAVLLKKNVTVQVAVL
jgi:hypothetical protein